MACLTNPISQPSLEISPMYIISGSHSSGYEEYGLDGQEIGVQVPVGARFSLFPRHPDWFWGPPSLLSNRYQGLFPRR
jgi:hypothetical protein